MYKSPFITALITVMKRASTKKMVEARSEGGEWRLLSPPLDLTLG